MKGHSRGAFAAEVARSTSVRALGQVVCAEMRRQLGHGSRQLVLVGTKGYDSERSWFESDEVPAAGLWEEMGRRSEQTFSETGTRVLAAAGRSPTVDVMALFDDAELARLQLCEEFWRPWRIERQLIHVMSGVGFLAVAKPRRERPYSPRELAAVGEIGATTAATFRAHAATALADELSTVVAALENSLPHVAVLFSASGRVAWMTDEALVRLGAEAARLGSARFVTRDSPLLDALRQRALTEASDRPRNDGAAPDRAEVALAAGEELLVRRFGGPTQDSSYVLVMILPCRRKTEASASSLPPRSEVGGGHLEVVDPASSAGGGPTHWARGLARWKQHGLSVRESEVATLASQGYTVLNIAARLNLSPSTVKTHFKRIYRKLRVASRVELTLRGFRQGP